MRGKGSCSEIAAAPHAVSKTRLRRRARDRACAREAVARADAAASDRGMADEERLRASGGASLQAQRRLGRGAGLRGARYRAGAAAVIYVEFRARRCGLQSAERGHLHADADAHRHAPAHRAGRASAPSRSRPSAAPGPGGSSSSGSWSRCWRGRRDVADPRKVSSRCLPALGRVPRVTGTHPPPDAEPADNGSRA